jgi:hypothetical protein
MCLDPLALAQVSAVARTIRRSPRPCSLGFEARRTSLRWCRLGTRDERLGA